MASDELTPSTFGLDSAYRERLNDAAGQQYSAERVDDHERARDLRRTVAGEERAVGAGAGRHVYPLPDDGWTGGAFERYVLKLAVPNDVPDGRDGKAQNRREARTWWATEAEFLVPVVAADPDGYWLVMPRGDPVDAESATLQEWLSWVSARAQAVHPDEIEERNVVVLGGAFRLCDYGLSLQ